MTILCGKQSYKLAKLMHDKEVSANAGEKTEAILEKVISSDLEEIRKEERTGWFISKSFFSIGMVGTIIGFMIAFSGLETLDPSDVNNLKLFISSMASGIATAMITTLVGLSCGQLLQYQYYNLSHARRSLIEDDEEKEEGN
jgi:flagellar motor component MotA